MRFTSSYRAFLSRLDEVHLLVAIAKNSERVDAVGRRNEINALCRGAIILLSSHVEAYVKELGEVALEALFKKAVKRDLLPPQAFYHISKDVIDEVKDTSDHIKVAEKIFRFIESDALYWSREGPFAKQIPSDRFNKGFSTPKFEKIRAYLNRFGYERYRQDFYRVLKADASTIENMLDHLVDIRNSIAHGEPSATKTPSDLKEMIEIISRFCRVTDQIFGNWCKNRLCSIR